MHHLIIEVPTELTDRILLEDLFEYILPAGVIYTFLNVSTSGKNEFEIEITQEDDVNIEEMSDRQLSQVSNYDNLDPNDYNNRSATSTGKVFSVDLTPPTYDYSQNGSEVTINDAPYTQNNSEVTIE